MEAQEAAVQDDAAIRAELIGEIFGEDAVQDVPAVDPEPEAAAPEIDPWDGVSPVIREQFGTLNQRVQDFDKIQFQLKQAERRIGSLTNEFHVAKQAAKAVQAATPTSEEMEVAIGNKKAWNELKEEFPEWAKAVDGRVAAERAETKAEILSQIPDVTSLRTEIETRTNQTELALLNRIAQQERKIEFVTLKMRHPDLEKVVASTEYAQWLATQPSKVQETAAKSVIADEADRVLQSYKGSRIYSAWADAQNPNKKTASEIAASRQQRLKQSQAVSGRQMPPQKSEADMSVEEIRRAEAARIWKGN